MMMTPQTCFFLSLFSPFSLYLFFGKNDGFFFRIIRSCEVIFRLLLEVMFLLGSNLNFNFKKNLPACQRVGNLIMFFFPVLNTMDQKQSSSNTDKSIEAKPFSMTSAREDCTSNASSRTSTTQNEEDEEPPTNVLMMKEKKILEQQEQLMNGSISSEGEDSEDQDQLASGFKRPRSQEQKKLDRILANRRSAR
jgi:hypothetical protein